MTKSLRSKLKLLRKAGLRAACAATACDPINYFEHHKKHSKLMGHCSAMAYVVKATCGGDIVSGRIKWKDGYAGHYWNRLPDGTEVDLTSCQFGGDGFTPLKKGRKVKTPKLTNIRFLMFAERVSKALRK